MPKRVRQHEAFDLYIFTDGVGSGTSDGRRWWVGDRFRNSIFFSYLENYLILFLIISGPVEIGLSRYVFWNILEVGNLSNKRISQKQKNPCTSFFQIF